jgi:hypothetical protein
MNKLTESKEHRGWDRVLSKWQRYFMNLAMPARSPHGNSQLAFPCGQELLRQGNSTPQELDINPNC